MRKKTLALSTLLLFACQTERQKTEPTAETAPKTAKQTAPERDKTPTAAPTVDQVKEAPNRFYGKQVRLAGEVDEIHNDRAFELEGTGWAFDDNITVLTKTPVQVSGGPLARGDELIITGTVRPFVTADIERDLGWDLAQEIEVRLKERPVLIADAIRKVGEYGRWDADTSVERPVRAIVTIVTTVDPDVLVGQKVDLGRERVQAVMSKGMWVGPSPMSQVFVMPQAMPTGVEAGDHVQVSGTLRKVPKDAAKTWGMPPEQAGVLREATLYVDNATVREVPAKSGAAN